ncbi:thiosulfate sulfurtransferase RDL2 PWA37_001664 [Arxiozyma heterogenica]|uniref:thiosulfate sulfurtransferase RDL2 n=1 Tax=Arxiozyma heterogenica TaxID=278026 RepID=UPI002EFAE3A9
MFKLSNIKPILNKQPFFLRSLSTKAAKIYRFEDIKQLVQHPDSKKILIDVREPEELKDYTLPNSINIPLKTAPGALGLKSEEFKEIFKFNKPSIDSELIFLCAKGARAQTAEELARSFGYENTGIYLGSIKEWLEKGGKDAVPKKTTKEDK